MNLLDVRKQFVVRSGRYDLVGENWVDAGADFFIQSGQRFLDRRSNVRAGFEAVHVGTLKAGDSFLEMPACWLIRKVEALGEYSRTWYPLHRLHSREATRYAFRHVSVPYHYVLASKRILPRVAPQPASAIEAPADAFPFQELLGDTWSQLTLEVLPVPSVTTTIRVDGFFYSDPLTQDADTNYWTLTHPDTLIKAALYNLEVFYRNTEGAQDWLSSIQLDLVDIEQQEVLADIQGKDEMGL